MTATGPRSGKAAACSTATCAAGRQTRKSDKVLSVGFDRRRGGDERRTLEAADGGVRGDVQGEVRAEVGVDEQGQVGASFGGARLRRRR